MVTPTFKGRPMFGPTSEVSNLRIGSDDNAIRHEQELIGILLVEPSLLDSESVEKILPKHIFRIELRSALEALRGIYRQGDTPTIENIPEYLKKIGQPGAIEYAELSMLVAKAPLTAQVDQCAEKVLANAIKRETYAALSQRLSAMAKSDGKLNTGDFIADMQSDLAHIQEQIGGAAPERLPRLLEGYHETDLGNAERLVDRYGDEILYCHPWKSWLAWDGQRWKPDEDAQVRRLAQKVARSMWNEVADKPTERERVKFAMWVKSSESTTRLNHMMIEAQAMRPVLPGVLDADPMLLNIENGVLDLRTGKLLPHDSSLLMTKLFRAEYDPEAECPKWLTAIDRWTRGDKGLALYIQMALGYCLTGLTDEHCVFFPYGVGANGKTTLFETARRMFGDYGSQIKIDALLGHHFSSAEGPSPGIIKLKGSRLVITSEVPEGRRLNASLIKDLSGGDSITARDLFRSTETFRATHKLFVIGNYKPRISDNSEGMWRRVRVIPFDEIIPKEEREPMEGLIEGFLAEGSGILNWLLEGCLLWQTNRLAEPPVVRAATQEYRDEMDALLEFIEDEKTILRPHPQEPRIGQQHVDGCGRQAFPWAHAHPPFGLLEIPRQPLCGAGVHGPSIEGQAPHIL